MSNLHEISTFKNLHEISTFNNLHKISTFIDDLLVVVKIRVSIIIAVTTKNTRGYAVVSENNFHIIEIEIFVEMLV